MELGQALEEALEDRLLLLRVLDVVEVVSALDMGEHRGLRILVKCEHLRHEDPLAMQHLEDPRLTSRGIHPRIRKRIVAGSAHVGLQQSTPDLEIDEPGEASAGFAPLTSATHDAATELLLHPREDRLPSLLSRVGH